MLFSSVSKRSRRDMKRVLGGIEKNAAGARNGETAQASRSSRNRHGKVEGEEGFAAFGLATDDADSFLGPQRSDEPASFVGALREAVSGFDRQQAHRRRPPAALDSAGGEQVSRNSFSSICRASCWAATASSSPAMFMSARRLPWA